MAGEFIFIYNFRSCLEEKFCFLMRYDVRCMETANSVTSERMYITDTSLSKCLILGSRKLV